MPSTYTVRNRLEQQAPGENNNTWGDRLNDNVIELMDEAADGVVSFTLSGSRTLTVFEAASDEARKRTINITGGTGGTVTIPNVEKFYMVRNASSGGVTFTTGTGTTAVVAANAMIPIFCTGNDEVYAATFTDFGTANISTTGSISGGSLSLTGNASVGGTLGVTGLSTFSARGDFAAGLRATGNAIPPSGIGLELRSSTTSGFITAENRNAGTKIELALQGAPLRLFGGTAANEFINLNTNMIFFVAGASGTANLFINGSNQVRVVTSSERYKMDIEDIDPAYSYRFLNEARPIYYRGNPETTDDDPKQSWWGYSAEQLEKIDPRLVVYRYDREDLDEDGTPRDGAELMPAGVAYDRTHVHLHVVLRDVIARLIEAEARIAALEAA